MALHERFVFLSNDLLEQYLRKITSCLEQLSEDQIWSRSDAASNSAGNLVLHLCGNLSQWVLRGLGEQTFERHRSLEFSAEREADRAGLIARLTRVVQEARTVIAGLGEPDLAAARLIQGYDTDGMGAVLQGVEHMAYHTGQIVFLTKAMLGPASGIDFYPQHRGE